MAQYQVIPVPRWSHEELSRIFWHHHKRFFQTNIAGVVLGLCGVGLLIAGYPGWAAMFGPPSLLLTAIALWHRASASMLGKLRFPSREGSE